MFTSSAITVSSEDMAFVWKATPPPIRVNRKHFCQRPNCWTNRRWMNFGLSHSRLLFEMEVLYKCAVRTRVASFSQTLRRNSALSIFSWGCFSPQLLSNSYLLNALSVYMASGLKNKDKSLRNLRKLENVGHFDLLRFFLKNAEIPGHFHQNCWILEHNCKQYANFWKNAKMRGCLKKFSSIFEFGAVQKFVNLVDLAKSFLTG